MASLESRTLFELAPFLKATSRGTGRRIVGSRGSGKTRLLSLLCLTDLILKVPTIVIDPTGALTSWLFSDLDRESEAIKRAVLPRLRYYNLAGENEGTDRFIPTFPLLYEREGEYLQDIVQRPLQTWLRTDPVLVTAPMLGKNALLRIGSYAGMLLYSMTPRRQLIEAEALLTNPHRYRDAIQRAVAANPDELTGPAHYFLEEFPKLAKNERDMQTGSFRTKLVPLLLNPRLKAIYGADRPSVTTEEIVDDRLFVILDFSGILDPEQKTFAVLWLYSYFIDAFRVRGPGKDQLPIAFYIDEASYILPSRGTANTLLQEDFLQFMQQTARQNNIWVTLVHQELRQFADAVNDMLMYMGTQVFGSTIDAEGSKDMAQRFLRYNPYQVKEKRNVHAVIEQKAVVIDEQNQYFTYDEQLLAYADRFRDLATFQFLYGVGKREGSLPRVLSPLFLEEYSKGRYPSTPSAQAAKRAMAKRDGRPLTEVLAEITARDLQPTPPPPSAPPPQVADASRSPAPRRAKKLEEDWE